MADTHIPALRWKTGNPLTAISALYPAAFGEAIAVAYKLNRAYMLFDQSWTWTFACVEIQTHVRELLEEMPSHDQVMKHVKDSIYQQLLDNLKPMMIIN